jgi:hypothetical protein
MAVPKNRVTLKALANVSPGFALKPWVQKSEKKLFATLKGLRGRQTSGNGMRFPRVAKSATLG